MCYRVIVAHESDLVLLGVRTVMAASHDAEWVGEARSTAALIALGERTQPDVILHSDRLDPAHDVLTTVAKLKQVVPLARQLVMGEQVNGLMLCDMLDAEVNGYLYSGDDLTHCLHHALMVLRRDRHYLSPTASSEYLVSQASPMRDWRLDGQSRTILRHLAQGLYPTEIAQHMGLPSRRVYWILNKLRRRFGATTNEHMLCQALRSGFMVGDG